MPANLPPQYYEAEKNYRSAKSPLEKIVALEEMLAIMPKHKGTDHLRADLRAKIAKLNESLDKKSVTQRMSLMIPKEGAGQVVVIGLPNAGKSQLVGSVTNANPTVADYPFTTKTATPGMMEFENIQIQLIDTPPLTDQPPEWWLANIIRRADALLVLIDLSYDPLVQMDAIGKVLAGLRIRLGAGKAVVEEDVPISYKKALVVGNKMELDIDGANYKALLEKYGGKLAVLAISAKEKKGLEELKRQIFEMLDIIRVYTKAPGQKSDITAPIILPKGSRLEAAAAGVHKDFAAKLKYARIWGSGKHDGIMAKRDHILQDGDVIELHL